MLMDQAERVAELVQHHPAQFVVGRVGREPAVVHGRLVDRDLPAHRAQVRPGAVALLEGDPDVGILVLDNLVHSSAT